MRLRALMLLAAFIGTDHPNGRQPVQSPAGCLSDLPGVASVEAFKARGAQSHLIIHVLNWHFIPKTLFAADMRDQSVEPISDQEIDREYATFLAEVECVQHEQADLLRAIIQQFGTRRVHYEGLSQTEAAAFRQLVNALKRFSQRMPAGKTPIEEFLLEEFRADMLRIGAPGHLLMSGELNAVLPVDDARLLKAAYPVQQDGTVRLDLQAIERREDAMVKNLLAGGPVTIVVLGGAHDLSDNVPKSCEYVRLATKRYMAAAGVWASHGGADGTD